MSGSDEQTKLVQEYLDQFTEDSKIPPVEIALLGSCGVGKRSILNRIVRNAWLELPDYTGQPWPDSDHLIHGKHVAVRWNAVSVGFAKECTQRMLRNGVLLASNSESCMLVYNVTHADSFKQLESTCEFWLESEKGSAFSKVKLFVVASRVDREESDWQVTLEQGRDLSRRLDAPFLEVSARANTGLDNEIITGIIEKTLCQRASLEITTKCAETSSEPGRGRIMLRRLKRCFRV